MPTLTPTTLTTNRLQLRWMDQADAPALFALFSDPAVTRYWSTPAWTDIAQSRAFIDTTLAQYAAGSGLRFAILLAETGQMIGSIKLYDFYDANRRCDIGYALLQAQWGKGLVGEAMRAVIEYAFHELNINRIEADIDPRNEASAKVLERMAFVREGYMRERWIVNGEVCDTAFYGLLRRDWDAR
jgi:ribosomal-protein-alanine N-acetyltransferase